MTTNATLTAMLAEMKEIDTLLAHRGLLVHEIPPMLRRLNELADRAGDIAMGLGDGTEQDELDADRLARRALQVAAAIESGLM